MWGATSRTCLILLAAFSSSCCQVFSPYVLVSVHVVHPYSSIDMTAAWKKLRFILLVKSDFDMTDSLWIAVNAFASHVLMSVSVDDAVYWPPTQPNMPFQRRRKLHILLAWVSLADNKTLWYSHKLLHRKRVTCELHDSYFRSMMIKTCHSKDGGSGIFCWPFLGRDWVGIELLYFIYLFWKRLHLNEKNTLNTTIIITKLYDSKILLPKIKFYKKVLTLLQMESAGTKELLCFDLLTRPEMPF